MQIVQNDIRNDGKMIKIRRLLVLSLICTMALLLSACGVSEKEKNAIFKCMKKENLILVDEMDFDDYSDSETVSNAPVPGYTEYYTYVNGNTSYRICFEGYYVKGEGKVFTSSVRETKGNEEISQKYYFKKTKLLKRMKLTDAKYSFYKKTYEKDDPLGIQKIYYNGTTVTVAIDKEPSQFKDDSLLQFALSLLNDEEKTTDIVCNIGGNTYSPNKVSAKEYNDYYAIQADFKDVTPARLVSFEYDGLVFELDE